MGNFIFKHCLPVLLLCSAYACSNSSNSTSAFKDTDTLTLIKKIPFDSIPLNYPSIKVQGKICCAADNGSEYFSHLYTFPDFKYIKSFGRKGHALNELTHLLDFDFQGNEIFALSGNGNKILKFNVEGDLNSPEIIKYDENLSLASFCHINNGHFIGYNTLGKHRLTEISEKGTVMKQYMEIPEKDIQAKENTHWIGVVGFNGKYVVSPTQYGEVIDIMDVSTNDIDRFVGDLGKPEYFVREGNGWKMTGERYKCFISMSLGTDYCYTYFQGIDHNMKDDIGENSIRKYDYNGNAIKRYLLKDVVPSSIYVDEKNSHIYCIIPDDDNMVYQYQLD